MNRLIQSCIFCCLGALLMAVLYVPSVIAFGGGGHGRTATTYKGGINAIGVHFGGELVVCTEHSTNVNGLCKCDDGYEPINGECLLECGKNEVRDHEKECICDTVHNYYGETGNCQLCSGEGRIVKNNECVCDEDSFDEIDGLCYSKCNVIGEKRDDTHTCICDHDEHYHGNAGNCQLCSGEGTTIYENNCICNNDINYYGIPGDCQLCNSTGEALNDNTCTCNNALNWYGEIGNCQLCSDSTMHIVENECVCNEDIAEEIDGNCYLKCNEDTQKWDENYNCICDNDKHYYGNTPDCTLCAGTGTTIRDDNCVCNNDSGYYGETSNCQLCSDPRKIIIENECICNPETYDTVDNECLPKCETWQTRDLNNVCQDVLCELNANIYENDVQICACPEHRDTTGNMCGNCAPSGNYTMDEYGICQEIIPCPEGTGTDNTLYTGGSFINPSHLTCYCPENQKWDNASSTCISATGATCTSWTTSECGTGYYCKFTPTSCIENPTSGVCKTLPTQRKTYTASDGYEYFMVRDQDSPYYYDWWSGQSLCASQNKQMVHLADVHCSPNDGGHGSCSDSLLSELGTHLYGRGTWTADPYEDGNPNSCVYYLIAADYLPSSPVWYDVGRTQRRSILCRSSEPVQ